MATKSTKMGHFNKQPSSKAQAITGCIMATHSRSRAWRNAVDLELISIKVEFGRLIAAQRNRSQLLRLATG
ncbi:MAG TPA: hypothetical protein VKS99_11010, partial [Blastocatellia bacterium]|nr:hypothetical protein [Blastocatellia bacterium]